ncbi:MAG TPA: Fe3+/spermidine/putrescine ABC transporter ATP-binding protein [Raoultella sp.]|nr:Fe3+/spermidine/putrescine ABC transporter ATP-binding protein [Raoultella sp.]
MLQISHLFADYGGKPVLADINLTLDSGELLVVLGPSGCGKTTLLNLIAGFVPYQHGSIVLEGQRVTGPGAERGVVFQHEGLLPWRNVQDNVALGLQLAGVDKALRRETAAQMLKKVGLEGAEKRFIWQLSGGQRQRVALARALAIEPDVLVLDEPLSNLDAKVRLNVRHEIKALQKKLGFTSLIVTHDQQEALVMADRIAVLNNGRIEQLGTPEEIYQRPATPFVADFMGADNKINSRDIRTLDGIHWRSPQAYSATDSGEQVIYFRSTDAALLSVADSAPQEGLTLDGIVEQSAFLGHLYRHSVRCRDRLLLADSTRCWPASSPVRLHVPTPALHIFPSSHAS